MIREEIKKVLKEATGVKAKVEYPLNPEHGDYSSNVALVSDLKLQEALFKIEEYLKREKPDLPFKIQAENGFINFSLSKEYLQKQVKEILKQKEKFGNLDVGGGRRVQVEFISANPTGPLTVGNARGGLFGDVLASVLEKAGFKVERAYYVNDLGKQIEALGHSVLKDEKALYKGDYIEKLNKKLKGENAQKVGRKAAEIIIEDYIKKTVKQANIKFDEWYYESKLAKYVDETLKVLRDNGLLYPEENALWFKSSHFGDERDRVLVKSDSQKTYLAGDLALHKYKFEKKKFDKVINIWGADHFGDVAGLQAGVEALGHKGKLEIILLQFVTVLKKGKKLKISKRKGNIVALKDLLDEVGVDVVRFFFLQKSPNTHLNFDLDLAKEQSEKNPVYYVQYAHARICSILKKNSSSSAPVSNRADRHDLKQKLKLLEHPLELALIKQLIKLPEIVEDIASDYQVQRLSKYAMDVATHFHKFYTDCRVINEKKPELTQARLALVKATQIVLKNTLDLMGITAPEKM